MRIHLRTHDAQPSLLEWSPRARAVEPAAIVEEESPRINGITIGDVINLDGVEVEVMGIDRDGFIWRTVDTSREAVDDGDVAWNEVVHITLDVWSTHTKPVEAPPPSKKARAKKPSKKGAESAAPAMRSVDRSTVPAYLLDLAALAMDGWWTVVTQHVTRPEGSLVSRCPDLDTARTVRDRAIEGDKNGNNISRIAVFAPDGSAPDGETWTRHAPISTAVEAHPEAQMFRVAVECPAEVTSGAVDAQEWASRTGLCLYVSSYQRITPAEVDEGYFWLFWRLDGEHVITEIPRALVVIVERRVRSTRVNETPRVTGFTVEPAALGSESHALRTDVIVSATDGTEWRVLHLGDSALCIPTNGKDETVTFDLDGLVPNLDGSGKWWVTAPKRPKKRSSKKAAR